MLCIQRSKKVKGESHENKYKQEESLYIALIETKQIAVADGNATFCSHFKYLGSWVSFSLRDNHNVAKRIASVNTSRAPKSVCLRAQLSQTHRINLQVIALKMRYLEYTLTWSSSQKDAISPIEAFTEAIRLATL